MKIVPGLYHTYPAGMLHSLDKESSVFIEATGCLENGLYYDFFLDHMQGKDTILDCGVGMSPDLKNPTAHTSSDPHWAARYLELLIGIEPRVVIIPDILNDGHGTWSNFALYSTIIDRILFSKVDGRCPLWMYVIQGQTKEEAKYQIDLAANIPYIDYIGFPRIVDYYGEHSGDVLGQQRIEFIQPYLQTFRLAGKQVHLLGMNSIEELKFAAINGLSTDTRIASMAALASFDVTEPRPANLNLDLNREFSQKEKKATLTNIKTLNNIYNTLRQLNDNG